ncbi:hypothetical protein [Streptomyces sp. A5-4]|uniref:hypothetical protein n=1 Tax=Streptomyces sp. A5-4 TaxID=3384771 RepID=UPI003DAA20C8
MARLAWNANEATGDAPSDRSGAAPSAPRFRQRAGPVTNSGHQLPHYLGPRPPIEG